MLITKKIIVPNRSHYKFYLDKGIFNSNDNTIEFDIFYLKPTSPIEVVVFCDICKLEKKIKYKAYTNSLKTYNIYACSTKCSQIKNKMTNLEKYGYECSLQNPEVKNKIKKTNLEKYGVENVFQNEEIKDKIKKTNLEKYGVENVFQNEEIKEKSKQTNLKKYRVEYASQNTEIKEKIKLTNLEKYGVCNYTKTDDYLRKSKFTNLDKYNVEHYSKSDEFKERSKQSNLERYGVENYSKTEESKSKVKQTNLEKYGVENPFQNEEFKNKSKQTNLEKHGVEYYTQTKDYLTKTKETCINKYGVENYSKSEESRKNFIISNHSNYIRYINDWVSLFKCDLNKDHEFEIKSDNFHGRLKQNIPLCTICYPIGDNKSIKEKVLLKYIQSVYSGEIVSGYRDGIEIDIYLPDVKIGIEFNGLYWHSNKFKEPNYHINKQEYFKEKDIDIKFIYEDDFDNNFDIIKSQINNWLGLSNKIYARKTQVKQIANIEEYRNFLNNNHIQGFVPSKLIYGLYYQDQLVSLMSFDKKEGRLNMPENEWNLNRFCNLLNHQIIGGASKLLKHFIKINNPSRIISYADKDWSNGNLYFTLEFSLVNESKPDYKYIIDGLRKSKQNFTKTKLAKLGHDISLTESQIMNNLCIHRIYDSGKMKFEKFFN